ncbi:MAG: biopolymer transporter ExbD [Gammaproteobacteria bacterium]|nr:biopolymer transporter ExbD [Gammaproteobacteria bacterium]MCI0590178.1 biopolymer transporter ExbD [Gammaproteobacteria bacterium]
MKFQSRRKDDVEINIINLIDILLVLLIFFVMTTTFSRKSEINITLPEASKELREAKPDAINVNVDAESHIYVNDELLLNAQLSTIKEAIYAALGDLVDAPVIISADAQTPHQTVIRVMDAARQLGLRRLSFMTQIVEPDESR